MMDRNVDGLWRAGAAPFDGLTIATPTIPTHELHVVVSRLVGILEIAFGDAALRSGEDWLEHDGFVTESEPAGWGALNASVLTVEALVEASPVDTMSDGHGSATGASTSGGTTTTRAFPLRSGAASRRRRRSHRERGFRLVGVDRDRGPRPERGHRVG